MLSAVGPVFFCLKEKKEEEVERGKPTPTKQQQQRLHAREERGQMACFLSL